MSRSAFSIEKALRIYAENSQTSFVDVLFGAGAPVGTSGETADAPIGSIFLSTSGSLYQKIADTDSAVDWQLNGATSAVIGTWRPESVVAVTSDTQGAGTRDVVASPFSDDNGTTLAPADFVVGKYVISGSASTPVLLEITAVSGDDVTFALASSALVEDDTFVVKNYLPDVDGQENSAIVNYNGSIIIKLADVDWSIATGINLSGGYTAGAGVVAGGDSVELAIQKLDGNVQEIDENVDDLIALSGVPENSQDFGFFDGDILADEQTAKQLFQRIEDLLGQIRGIVYTGITGTTTVDQVPHATVQACKWLVTVFEEATPANKQAFEVYALTNGSTVDDTAYAKLKVGSNFNLTISVAIVGAFMNLNVASTTAGVTATVRRIEVVQSIL